MSGRPVLFWCGRGMHYTDRPCNYAHPQEPVRHFTGCAFCQTAYEVDDTGHKPIFICPDCRKWI